MDGGKIPSQLLGWTFFIILWLCKAFPAPHPSPNFSNSLLLLPLLEHSLKGGTKPKRLQEEGPVPSGSPSLFSFSLPGGGEWLEPEELPESHRQRWEAKGRQSMDAKAQKLEETPTQAHETHIKAVQQDKMIPEQGRALGFTLTMNLTVQVPELLKCSTCIQVT